MSFRLFLLGLPDQIDGGDIPVIKIFKTDSMFGSGLRFIQVFFHDDPGHRKHRPVPVFILDPDDQTVTGIGYFVVFNTATFISVTFYYSTQKAFEF